MKTFNRIALVCRQDKPHIAETLKAVHQHLIHLNKTVVLENHTATFCNLSNIPLVDHRQLNKAAELIIVVGGDGSILQAAQIAINQNLPILGINRGNLGFLADIAPNELEKLNDILSGNHLTETRCLLEANICTPGHALTKMALNEVVLFPGELAHMIEFDVYIDDQLVCHQRADGMIVATPTGSTAYALSGGGPIMHPNLNTMVLVPMFAHTLSSRPIVINSKSQVRFFISANNKTAPHVSCDGHERIPLPLTSTVTVSEKTEKLSLIHPTDYLYFDTLQTKLGWETKPEPAC